MISRNITPKYSWSWFGGGAPMMKGAEIRRKLLLEAVRKARVFAEKGDRWNTVPGVSLHHEGGRAFDRHARRMVKDGFLKMERYAFKQSSHGGSNDISWSVLVPTEKGFEEADRLLKKAA